MQENEKLTFVRLCMYLGEFTKAREVYFEEFFFFFFNYNY